MKYTLILIIFTAYLFGARVDEWTINKGINSVKKAKEEQDNNNTQKHSYQKPMNRYFYEGYYLGVSFGSPSNNGNEMIDFVQGGKRISSSSMGSKIRFGYQNRNNLNTEFSYTNYGSFIYENASFEYKSINMDYIFGFRFFNQQIQSSIMTGMGYLTTTQTDGGLLIKDYPGNSLNIRYGINILYEPNELKGVGFIIGYEANLDILRIARTINEINNERKYLQNIGLMSFGIQYKF